MSVIPLKADIRQRGLHVRLVPIAEVSPASRSANGGRFSDFARLAARYDEVSDLDLNGLIILV